MFLKEKFEKRIYKKGFNEVIGNVTSGLIGTSTAEKKAKEEEERQRRALERERQERERENKFNEEMTEDTEKLNNSLNEEIKQGKPQTTVDFSSSIKGTGEDDEEEDKLKKSLRKAFRG